MASHSHLLPSVFGILGNIISFCVFLAPVPTFRKIYRKKSTQGFQSVPYSVSLFSCMLLLYYGYLKTHNGTMIITINSIGCAIETSYIVFFLVYATRESWISTLKMLALFNVLSFGVIVVTTILATEHGSKRVAVVGWICAIFSVCVFAAPLSVMRMVIRTKSVEYMPFSLSFFLTLCAVVWFVYGLLIKDYYVATPNVLGFVFGIGQMILYMIYKGNRKQVRPMVQPNGGPPPSPPPIVVDLRAIVEVQEKLTVDAGVISEIQDNDGELRVVMEMQDMAGGDEAGGGEKEQYITEVCVDLEGEKTIMPSVV